MSLLWQLFCVILTLFMGHIKINRINLAFKISVSIGDNTNVLQTVAPDKQFNQSAVEIAVKYLSIGTLGGACNYCVLAYFISKG